MKFASWIGQSEQELISSLQGCVQIPSVYTDDDSPYPFGKPVKQCLDYMLNLAQSMGFETRNVDDYVGWCEYGQGEEMVAVLGHLDVVPEGDGWTVPPYEGRVVDGKIYGRGTMDDKGPVVAALYALKAVKDSGVALKRRVRIMFGTNEESGSADMKYYLAHGGEIPVMGFTPDGEYPVINGEKGLVNELFTRTIEAVGAVQLISIQGGSAHNIVPNYAVAELLCPPELAGELAGTPQAHITCTPTQQGVRIEARGQSAHGGSPQEGENAIGRLLVKLNALPLTGDLAQAVGFLAQRIGTEYDGASLGVSMADADSGPLTFNLGIIRGDKAHIEVKFDCRYPVTQSYEDCMPKIDAQFAQAGFASVACVHKQSLYISPDSELVQKLMQVYTDHTGQALKPKCIAGGTYAKMIPNTVAFGPVFPGDEVREHKPDEFMELSRLLDNANILASAIYELAT